MTEPGFLFKPTGGSSASQAVKETLLERFKDASEGLTDLSQKFYATEPRSDAIYRELIESFIELLDSVLSVEGVEDSTFTRNLVRPLKKMRLEAADVYEQWFGALKAQSTRKLITLTEDQVRLYVALYQVDGNDLSKWAIQLLTIERHMTGRPIYAEEAHASEWVRQKFPATTEGYAVVIVSKHSILPSVSSRPQEDRFGHPLLNLEAGSVSSAHIETFVYMGKRYYLQDNELVEE